MGDTGGVRRAPHREALADQAPLARALARVGDRWSLLVVDALLAGPRRFGELLEGIDGIATNVLAQRLRHLEAERLVVATPYQERPARYAYELTASGRALAGALRLLAEWGAATPAADGGAPGAAPAHGACGTPLEVRWWCPACGVPVGPGADGPTFI